MFSQQLSHLNFTTILGEKMKKHGFLLQFLDKEINTMIILTVYSESHMTSFYHVYDT